REEIAPDTFRIRFEPEEEGVLTSSTPGQHIVVEGCIDGLAVRRPYTLTSDNKERRWREITIQKEAHGLFSHWLATVPPAEAEIKISQPSGTFAADLDDPSPLILMVAGIGVTPAIAIARSRIKKSTGPKIIIDHSARTSKKLVSAVELEDLAAKSGSIFYKFRRTSGGERIKGIDLVGLHQENPDCRWMICGPGRFEAFVESKLIEIGVNPDRIAVEHFRPPEAKTTQPFQPDKSALFIGVLITLLTLIILLFDWVPIGLQKWQATTSGHWISGFALLLFLGAQWWLPKLRWHKPSGSVSKAIHWHRRIGAISPLLLILHGNSIGTGILGLLSMVFFINTIVGLADRSIVSSPKLQLKYLQWWLFPHIILSILFTTLSIYHVWIIIIHGGP
nr:FAD-binding oxidoreductase [Pseudomonadales bacterium]